MDATTQTAPAPAPDSTVVSLTDMRTARAEGKTYTPPADVAVQAAAAVPDPEVEADPDLRKAIDEIEAPAAEETPQQKAARTKRHKEAAIKRRVTNLAKAREAEKTAREAAERELEDWRAGRRTYQPPAPQPAPTAGDPASATRPKPTLADFPLEKFATEDDPYEARSAAYHEAVADWKFEQRDAESRASRQREQAERDRAETLRSHEGRVVEAKTRYADYDAVVSGASFDRTPATQALIDLVFRSPLSADLVYHLSKHPEDTRRLLASRSRDELIEGLAGVKATVTAAVEAAKKPAAMPPPTVTAAAEPLTPVTAGAGTSAAVKTPRDIANSTSPLAEWRAQRARGAA